MKPIFIILLIAIIGILARAETVTVGVLTMEMPTGFKAESKQEKDPDWDVVGKRWEADGGRVIQVLYYVNQPKHDRGPMIVAAEEDIEVAGQKTKLTETRVFFGATQKVLLVCLRLSDTNYMIYSERMPKEEFKRFLRSIKLTKKEANHALQPTPLAQRSVAELER